jgi:hypothetical protein
MVVNTREFNNKYRTLLWAVDLLGGDNPMGPDITDHGIVDADAAKYETDPPAIYTDVVALLEAKGDDKSLTPVEKADLNAKHNLLTLPGELVGMLGQFGYNTVLGREINMAYTRLQGELAGAVPGIKAPNRGTLWGCVTGQVTPPTLSSFRAEIVALQDQLVMWLRKAGHKATRQNLQRVLYDWHQSHRSYGLESRTEIEEIIRTEIVEFVGLFRSRACKIPSLAPYADQIDVKAYQLKVKEKMNFDAGLSYLGRNPAEGWPVGYANFEWNAGRPASRFDIQYVACHEATHWMNATLMDLQRRAGKLPPAAALLTMSSQRAGNEEGLAQTMWECVYGGTVTDVVESRGVEYGIVMVLDQLQDIARLAAAVGFLHLEADEEARRKAVYNFIRTELCQDEHIAHKYAGEKKRFWRELPGGITYAPQYYYGSRAYRDAIGRYGVEKVLEVGMHTQGLVDLPEFETLVAV